MLSSITVVIPTYNRGQKVLQALDSVLAQSHPLDEIIVVDDGSTDNTEEALKQFGDKIRYFKIPNQGVSAARNFGWRQASSHWIAFLDSDDFWHPEKTRKQYEALTTYPDCVCFFTGSIDDEGERIDDLHKMHPSLKTQESICVTEELSQFFLYPRHPFLQSILVKKDALAATGGMDETLRVAEDTKLLYELVLTHGYAAIGDALVTITRTRTTPGLSDGMDPQTAQTRYSCYARVQSEVYWRLVGRYPAAAAQVRRNLAYFVSRLSELACVNRDYPLARTVAYEGLLLTRKPTEHLRCWLALLTPRFSGRFWSKKWH